MLGIIRARQEDWRVQLAPILQPLPFPDAALEYAAFTRHLGPTLALLAADKRCDVHSALLPLREGKEGWLGLLCPGQPTCFDDGHLFTLAVCLPAAMIEEGQKKSLCSWKRYWAAAAGGSAFCGAWWGWWAPSSSSP